MTLLDICGQLDELDDRGVIYAKRVGGEFMPMSEATIVMISPKEMETPAREIAARHCAGFHYCLEIFIAQEAVEVWSLWRDGTLPTPAQRAEAVCYKANNDAWGPPNFPVSGQPAGR